VIAKYFITALTCQNELSELQTLAYITDDRQATTRPKTVFAMQATMKPTTGAPMQTGRRTS
jgi:hypothetical protein